MAEWTRQGEEQRNAKSKWWLQVTEHECVKRSHNFVVLPFFFVFTVCLFCLLRSCSSRTHSFTNCTECENFHSKVQFSAVERMATTKNGQARECKSSCVNTITVIDKRTRCKIIHEIIFCFFSFSFLVACTFIDCKILFILDIRPNFRLDTNS